MEANNPQKIAQQQQTQQKDSFEGSLMLHRYQEYVGRLIDSTCQKIFSGKKVRQYLTSQVSARKEGHLNIIAQQLKSHSCRVLGQKIQSKIKKLKMDIVDNLIFIERNCQSLEDFAFEEEEEYLNQVDHALGRHIDKIKKMREEQNRLDPL